MTAYAVFAEGITNLQEFDSLKDEIKLWAAQAINKTADTSRTRAARLIRSEVNFPASYVNPADPAQSVLERGGAVWAWWMAAVGRVLAGAGLWLLRAALRTDGTGGTAPPARRRKRRPG